MWLWGFLFIVLGEAAGLMLLSASLNMTPRIEFAFSGAGSPAWPRSPFPTGRVRAGAAAPGWVPPTGCWDLAGGLWSETTPRRSFMSWGGSVLHAGQVGGPVQGLVLPDLLPIVAFQTL